MVGLALISVSACPVVNVRNQWKNPTRFEI
jgi:hypothetical protein